MDFFGQTPPPAPTSGQKNKKLIMFGLGGVVLVIIIIMVVMAVISSSGSTKNNLIIDGVIKTKISTSGIVEFFNGQPYVEIEKIAPLVGYTFYTGKYGVAANQDPTKCYVKDMPTNNNSNGNEVAMFEYQSSTICKILLSNPSVYDYYQMAENVERDSNTAKLYISLPVLQKAFNVKYSYNATDNVLSISTLTSLAKSANAFVIKANYKGLVNDFANKKALVYGMIVFQTTENKFGVLKADGSKLIEPIYDSMTYLEGTNTFMAKINGKMGILNTNGGDNVSDIPPTYDDIKLMDNKLKYYLVKNGNKYGVVDKSGNSIIPMLYDSIGIPNPEKFPNNNITNPYILFDNCIPVQLNHEWGIIDIKGNVLYATTSKYTNYGLGCAISQDSGQNTGNVLLIPSTETGGAEGIVISTQDTINGVNKITYGVVSAQGGKPIISQYMTKIYMNANNEYYCVDSYGNVYRVKDMLSDKTDSTGDESTQTPNNETVQTPSDDSTQAPSNETLQTPSDEPVQTQ